MNKVKLKLNEKGGGGFYIMDGEEETGKMRLSIAGKNLRVYHTEVTPKAKGFANQMPDEMVAYARKSN